MNILAFEFDYKSVPQHLESLAADEGIFQVQQQANCTAAWATNYYYALHLSRVTIPQLLIGLGLDRDSAFVAAHAYLDYAVLFTTRGVSTATMAQRLEYPVSQALSAFNIVALASIHTLLADTSANLQSLGEEALPLSVVLDMTTEEIISQARAMAESMPAGYHPFKTDAICAAALKSEEAA